MNKLILAILILGLSLMVPGCKGKTEGEKAMEQMALDMQKDKEYQERRKQNIGKSPNVRLVN